MQTQDSICTLSGVLEWRVQNLVSESVWNECSFSILELHEFLYASFERQYKLRAYRTSSQRKNVVLLNAAGVKLMKRQELEKTLTTYFWWVNRFIQLPDKNLSG